MSDDGGRERARRIAGLSPERRRLLALLDRRGGAGRDAGQPGTAPPGAAGGPAPAPAPAPAPEPEVDEALLEDRYFTLQPGVFAAQRDVARLYDAVSRQLNATEFVEHSVFLNWGYVADGSPGRAPLSLPAAMLNRNPTRLVLELIGDCRLDGDDDVLDVACGRGGTVQVLRRYFQVRRLVGVDLSPQAVAFCRRTHRYPDTYFAAGDAQSLPLSDGCVDVVTNIESSHCYPDIGAFYREVFRLLRPGGCFLYTDVLPLARIAGCQRLLRETGFRLEVERDITANVLRSCDQIAAQHARLYRPENNPAIMKNFLATPDSAAYRYMRDGQTRYCLYRLRK